MPGIIAECDACGAEQDALVVLGHEVARAIDNLEALGWQIAPKADDRYTFLALCPHCVGAAVLLEG